MNKIVDIYIVETPDSLYPLAAFSGYFNFKLGIASPSATHYCSLNGIPKNAKYSEKHKAYVINE